MMNYTAMGIGNHEFDGKISGLVPFLDDVKLFESGVIRIYDVLFPSSVLLETDAYIRDFLERTELDGPISSAQFHEQLGRDLLAKFPGCEEHSVVARAALAGVPL